MDTPPALPTPHVNAASASPYTTQAPFYRLKPDEGYRPSQRYEVIPVSGGFFHIREAVTGRVKGFRCTHNTACALARQLETTQQ